MKNMGGVTLEIRYPKDVDGIAADPQPDWSFDDLLSELNSLENRLNASSRSSLPLAKIWTREVSTSNDGNRSGAFVMQVSDSEFTDGESEEDHHQNDRAMVVGRRFACYELPLSDVEDSGDEAALEIQSRLMDTVGFVEAALSELTHEHQLTVTEEMRSQVLELETDMMNGNEKFSSMLDQVQKYTETRREMDRKVDLQYQRKIAEALDIHLTAVQRAHEHKSQLEERRIRDDAVREEAQKREKLLREEKMRQDKAKADAEMQARLEAEELEKERVKALGAERIRAEEAAKKKVLEQMNNNSATAADVGQSQGSASDQPKSTQLAGNTVRSTENALKFEERRSLIYKEVTASNHALGLGSNMREDYRKHGQRIARNIRQITGSKENVRAKSNELIKLISGPSYPQSISIALFVEKFVSLCENPTVSFSRSLYAYGHVIVLVTSKVPLAMDLLIAELNRVCIYTVPKHIRYSKSAFETKEAYYKAIGYREEDGKIESHDTFVDRLGSYMKLYAALLQTEVEGIRNLHGIAEGWAWLARFLNSLPPNLYTAVALQSFLEMAGFTLHRRYRSQFKKILHIISHDFLSKLTQRDDPKMNKAVASIRNYIESEQFLKEPEGWQLETYIESHNYVESRESRDFF